MPKYIYAFGGGSAEGEGSQKDLLGGKGAGLAEMSRLGIPVPPGFTITTEVCKYYQDHDKSYPEGLERESISELKISAEEFSACVEMVRDRADALGVTTTAAMPVAASR